MAARSGIGGKIVAGCSCVAMAVSILLLLFVTFALGQLVSAVPELAESQAYIATWGGYVSYGCCCISGGGMILGIVLLLMGGKGEAEA